MLHQHMSVAKLNKQYKSMANGLKLVEAKMNDFDKKLKIVDERKVQPTAATASSSEKNNVGSMKGLYGDVVCELLIL